MKKKKISVVIPVFNEYENIIYSYERTIKVLKQLTNYKYEILYIDNCSNDGTKELLLQLAKKDRNIKLIFNSVNVGWSRSSYYAMINTTGDVVILLAGDMQEPPEMISSFIIEYEKGYKAVIGIKSKSEESKIMYSIRNMYYWLLNRVSEINHINQFMGFGLYDKSLIDTLRQLDDPTPYFRGMIPEFCNNIKEIEYVQEKRKKGKSHFNFLDMFDLAMLGITSYSKKLIHICTIVGSLICFLTFTISIITFMLKVLSIIDYPIGIAAISISVFFFGGVLMSMIGLIGEYVMAINIRQMKRPLVVEEKRINFNDRNQKK